MQNQRGARTQMVGGVLVLLSPSHLGLDLLDLYRSIVSNLSDAMLKNLEHTHLFNGGRHFDDLTQQSQFRLNKKIGNPYESG